MISDVVLPDHVGREFLMWLLFRSEQESGSFELAGEYVNFRVEDQLKLEGDGDVRQTDLKKGAPSISDEARTALVTGKLPTRMRVRLVVGDDEYFFVLDADLLEVRAAKIPTVPMKEPVLKLEQRMFHLSQIYRMMELLFKAFATERLDTNRWPARVKEIHQWMHASAN